MTSTPGTTTPETSTPPDTTGTEHHDLLEALDKHRDLFLVTTRDLTDEQAAARPTVSQLCIGGLVKHLATVEAQWAGFIVDGAPATASIDEVTPELMERRARQFTLLPGETLAGVVADYRAAARHTDEVVASVPDLGADHPLPRAPWFTPGARWSARRVVLHLIAETAQHAGHADILRETLDGARTMG